MPDTTSFAATRTGDERSSAICGMARRRRASARFDPSDEVQLNRRILAAIAELTLRTGRPPTYREVLAHVGIRSHRRLSDGVNELVRTGRLERLPGSRNLIVVQQQVSIQQG